MSDNTISIKKHILKYGLVYGALWVLMHSIFYMIYNHTGPINWKSITVEILLHVGVITYGIYTFKKINNRYLKFSDAIKIGVGITIIAFSILTIWDLTLGGIIESDLTDDILNERREKMILSNPELSPEEIKKEIPTIKNSPSNIFQLYEFILYLIVGLIISLIAGAIMHKKKKL